MILLEHSQAYFVKTTGTVVVKTVWPLGPCGRSLPTSVSEVRVYFNFLLSSTTSAAWLSMMHVFNRPSKYTNGKKNHVQN